MSNGIKVKKRDGSQESINLDKIYTMVECACEGLAGVSPSQEIQSGIQFYDGITTAEIQEILVRSASDLIDLDNPNYQFVAARLLCLVCISKSLVVIGSMDSHLWEHIYVKVLQKVSTIRKLAI